MEVIRAFLPTERTFGHTLLLEVTERERGIFHLQRTLHRETLHHLALDQGHQYHPAMWFHFYTRIHRSVTSSIALILLHLKLDLLEKVGTHSLGLVLQRPVSKKERLADNYPT
jgi:hypothetical protein